jgi:lipid II:glycine glycyltransferase (peptidoglycan interpeptide bridge formation enzyme)
MMVSSRYGLKVIDLYFNEQAQAIKADLIRYHYWSERVVDSVVRPQSTVVVDVRREPDVLLAGMASSTRRDIRRADREGHVSFKVHQADTVAISKFLRFFTPFATSKGIDEAKAYLLLRLARENALVLTSVEDSGGDLVWHVYMRAGAQSRQMYSASVYVSASEPARRRFLATANRYHHWRDLLMFRALGISTVDLGGICEPCEDLARMGIREFKTGFGGDIVRMFDCTKAASARGRIALWLRNRLVTLIYPRRRPGAEVMPEVLGRSDAATQGNAGRSVLP